MKAQSYLARSSECRQVDQSLWLEMFLDICECVGQNQTAFVVSVSDLDCEALHTFYDVTGLEDLGTDCILCEATGKYYIFLKLKL